MTDLAGRSDCRDTRKFKNRHLVLALLLAFALSAGYSHAQDLQRSDRLCRPVLIVSDDEDPDTVIRSSAAAKQARAELARGLQVFGFRAIDEDKWSSGLGFAIPDRSSTCGYAHAWSSSPDGCRRTLSMSLSCEHRHGWRSRPQLDLLGQLRIQIRSEILDLASQQRVDVFEEAAELAVTPNCMRSRPCLNDVLANGATDIGFVIGSMVGSWLDRQWKERDGATEGASASTVGGGSATCYTLTLRYFENSEALEILETMAEESASYRYHERIEASGTSEKKYFYVSTSGAAKLEERLAIALKDRGVDIDRDISMERDGTDLRITRMVPGSQSN